MIYTYFNKNTRATAPSSSGACCVGLYPASPLPGSSYWLLMMWGYDVIKNPRQHGLLYSTPLPTPRLAGDLSHYTTQHNTHERYIHKSERM